jgi:hypothetical protein
MSVLLLEAAWPRLRSKFAEAVSPAEPRKRPSRRPRLGRFFIQWLWALLSDDLTQWGTSSDLFDFRRRMPSATPPNHLIVAHEVTNVGTDKSQLANMANQAKAAFLRHGRAT